VYATTGINSLSTDFGNKATSLENKPDLSKLVEKEPVLDMAELVGAPHTRGTDDAHAVQDQKSVSEAVETTFVHSDGNHKRYLTLCCCCCWFFFPASIFVCKRFLAGKCARIAIGLLDVGNEDFPVMLLVIGAFFLSLSSLFFCLWLCMEVFFGVWF